MAEDNRDLRITADGQWDYRGSPIARIKLVELFASVLRRLPDGSYWLITPAERVRVQVDDAPFLVVEAMAVGELAHRRLELRTNIGRRIVAGADHPMLVRSAPNGEPRLYIDLGGGLEAAMSRPVWYQLVDLALADTADAGAPTTFGIWAGGVHFDLSALAGAEG